MSITESDAEAILSRLDSLLARVDQLDKRLQANEHALHELPGMAATAVNTLDQLCDPLRTEAANWPERLPLLLQLLEQFSRPELLETLTTLAGRQQDFLPLLKLSGDLPALLSVSVDALDEFYRNYELRGHDPDRLLRSLRNGVLDVETVAVVAAAGQALARSRAEARPASLLTLFKALSEPEFRHALGFALSFVRHFSRTLQADTPHSELTRSL